MVTHILASPDHERADFKLPAALATVQLYWERGDQAALADALEYLAGRGEPAQAAVRVRILAAAQSLRNSLGVPPPVGEREDVERHLAAARRELGEARFAAAWAEGCALDLDQVVASVMSGRLAPPSAASEAPARRSRSAGRGEALTRREREVAKLVAAGFSDRKIAETLAITEGTAGVHVHHILEKLGFRSRVQVRDWALAHGLIEKPPD
jgi:DNA-binding CsgD family transcriptional regulator